MTYKDVIEQWDKNHRKINYQVWMLLINRIIPDITWDGDESITLILLYIYT